MVNLAHLFFIVMKIFRRVRVYAYICRTQVADFLTDVVGT